MAKLKKLKETLLIVCEGSETENYYLEEVWNNISSNSSCRWASCRILPEINNQEIETGLTSKRKVRKLKPLPNSYIDQVEDNPEDYERYKATPLRYVREAELFLKSGTYTEAWAVFDNDNFSHLHEARNHADASQVRIALSSFCFEQWILFHYEKCLLAFTKSECKQNGVKIACNDSLVCIGNTPCLSGYLRRSTPLLYSKSTPKLFEMSKENLNKAYENAAWSRYITRNQTSYPANPYTDVDILVKRILNDDSQIVWFDFDQEIKIGGDVFMIQQLDNTIQISNMGFKTLLLNAFNFSLEYFQNPIPLSESLPFIEASSTKSFSIPPLSVGDYLNIIIDQKRLILKFR